LTRKPCRVPATKGSQRWLQQLVATDPGRLDSAIGLGELEWLSPLAEDDWAEYQDEAFLECLNVKLDRRSLSSFWPSGGPVWDGLARTRSGASVLIEAKAHVSEMLSSCGASPRSLRTIRQALEETKASLGVEPTYDWCSTYYQYANRLAHAYLMNELNGIHAHLVFVNFIGDSDVSGPASRAEWAIAIRSVHKSLGIRNGLPDYVRGAFIDVR